MSKPTDTPELLEELAHDFEEYGCANVRHKDGDRTIPAALRELAEMKRDRTEKAFALERDEDRYIDQDGTSWETPEDWLFTGVLGGCGCGSSEAFGGLALRVLALFAQPHKSRTWSIRDDERAEIIAHWMDSRELLEHGSSLGAAWLSDQGNQVYKALLPFIESSEAR